MCMYSELIFSSRETMSTTNEVPNFLEKWNRFIKIFVFFIASIQIKKQRYLGSYSTCSKGLFHQFWKFNVFGHLDERNFFEVSSGKKSSDSK